MRPRRSELAGPTRTTPQRDSRTFLEETRGIRLGSSQIVNVVLFSVACHSVTTLSKQLISDYLQAGDQGSLDQAPRRLWKFCGKRGGRFRSKSLVAEVKFGSGGRLKKNGWIHLHDGKSTDPR